MALHLRHRSVHDANWNLQQKLPFSTFGQQKMTPGGLSHPSKAAIMILPKVSVLLVCFFECVDLFCDCEHSTIKQNKTKTWQLKIILAHWHMQKDTNKAFVDRTEHIGSSACCLIVVCMQQNVPKKVPTDEETSFLSAAIWQVNKPLQQLLKHWKEHKQSWHPCCKDAITNSISCFASFRAESPKESVREGRIMVPKWSIWFNNVVHIGCERAEDFCEAAVCFTVVSLILQNNPDQMSHMSPPALGTCQKQSWPHGLAACRACMLDPSVHAGFTMCLLMCHVGHVIFKWWVHSWIAATWWPSPPSMKASVCKLLDCKDDNESPATVDPDGRSEEWSCLVAEDDEVLIGITTNTNTGVSLSSVAWLQLCKTTAADPASLFVFWETTFSSSFAIPEAMQFVCTHPRHTDTLDAFHESKLAFGSEHFFSFLWLILSFWTILEAFWKDSSVKGFCFCSLETMIWTAAVRNVSFSSVPLLLCSILRRVPHVWVTEKQPGESSDDNFYPAFLERKPQCLKTFICTGQSEQIAHRKFLCEQIAHRKFLCEQIAHNSVSNFLTGVRKLLITPTTLSSFSVLDIITCAHPSHQKGTGKLLTFLTAHCLCSQNGWSINIKVPMLQPLQNVPTFSSTIKHAGRVCPWVTFADAPQQWRHPAVCLEAWWHGKNKHCLCFGIHEHKRCKDFEQLNAMILFNSMFLTIHWDTMFIPFNFLAAELPTWRDDRNENTNQNGQCTEQNAMNIQAAMTVVTLHACSMSSDWAAAGVLLSDSTCSMSTPLSNRDDATSMKKCPIHLQLSQMHIVSCFKWAGASAAFNRNQTECILWETLDHLVKFDCWQPLNTMDETTEKHVTEPSNLKTIQRNNQTHSGAHNVLPHNCSLWVNQCNSNYSWMLVHSCVIVFLGAMLKRPRHGERRHQKFGDESCSALKSEFWLAFESCMHEQLIKSSESSWVEWFNLWAICSHLWANCSHLWAICSQITLLWANYQPTFVLDCWTASMAFFCVPGGKTKNCQCPGYLLTNPDIRDPPVQSFYLWFNGHSVIMLISAKTCKVSLVSTKISMLTGFLKPNEASGKFCLVPLTFLLPSWCTKDSSTQITFAFWEMLWDSNRVCMTEILGNVSLVVTHWDDEMKLICHPISHPKYPAFIKVHNCFCTCQTFCVNRKDVLCMARELPCCSGPDSTASWHHSVAAQPARNSATMMHAFVALSATSAINQTLSCCPFVSFRRVRKVARKEMSPLEVQTEGKCWCRNWQKIAWLLYQNWFCCLCRLANAISGVSACRVKTGMGQMEQEKKKKIEVEIAQWCRGVFVSHPFLIHLRVLRWMPSAPPIFFINTRGA